jgi:hypothetical protein
LKEFCWIEKAGEIYTYVERLEGVMLAREDWRISTNVDRLEGVLLSADCRRLEKYPQT